MPARAEHEVTVLPQPVPVECLGAEDTYSRDYHGVTVRFAVDENFPEHGPLAWVDRGDVLFSLMQYAEGNPYSYAVKYRVADEIMTRARMVDLLDDLRDNPDALNELKGMLGMFDPPVYGDEPPTEKPTRSKGKSK